MSDIFWTKCAVLIPIILAFFGASWVLGKHKDDMQKKYKDEIKEIESIVYSSEIIQYVIKILEESNEEKNNNPNNSYEDILANEKFSSYIKNITKSENKVSNVKYNYKNLQESISSLSKNFLYAGILIALLSAYHLFNIGLSFPDYNFSIFIILIIILCVILIQIGNHYKKYDNIKEFLSNKYDEIVIGVG